MQFPSEKPQVKNFKITIPVTLNGFSGKYIYQALEQINRAFDQDTQMRLVSELIDYIIYDEFIDSISKNELYKQFREYVVSNTSQLNRPARLFNITAELEQ